MSALIFFPMSLCDYTFYICGITVFFLFPTFCSLVAFFPERFYSLTLWPLPESSPPPSSSVQHSCENILKQRQISKMFISWCYCTYWRSWALSWEKVHNKRSSLCFSFRAALRVKKGCKLRIQNMSDFLWGRVDTTVGPGCVLNERVPWKLEKKTLFYR